MAQEYKIFASILGDKGIQPDAYIKRVAPKVDGIEVDYMDGEFVDRKIMGPDTVRYIKHLLGSDYPVSAHLMATNPDIDSFMDEGADIVVVHYGAIDRMIDTLRYIRSRKRLAGYAISPDQYPTELLTDLSLRQSIDVLFIMGVEPGKSGQKFNTGILSKIRALREEFDGNIQVDGGINRGTISHAMEWGANWFTVASGIFVPPEKIAENIKNLRNRIESYQEATL